MTTSPAAAIDRIVADHASAGFALPPDMIARAKASGNPGAFAIESLSYVASVRAERAREAKIDAMVAGVASFVPGASPTDLRSLAPDAPVRERPEADVDALVDSIVAFIPEDRRAATHQMDFDND